MLGDILNSKNSGMCVFHEGDGLPVAQHDGGKTSEAQKNCLNCVFFSG